MAANGGQQPVELTASQARALQSALRQWSSAKLVSPDLVSDLLATVQVVEEKHDFEWQKFAKYAFRLAILCLAFAGLNIIFELVFPRIIDRILALPVVLRLITTVGAAIAVHAWGYQRSLAKPAERHLNEAIHSLGALVFALAAMQLGKHLECGIRTNREVFYAILISLASTYGVVAVLVKSNLIWSCGMILLDTWFSLRVAKFDLYPTRSVLLGITICVAAYLMRYFRYTVELWSTTRIWGMLFLFNSLWYLSILGTNNFFFTDYQQGQRMQLFWCLSFFFAAAFSVWHGLKFRDSTTKGFGIVYLGINLVSNAIGQQVV